MKKTLYLLLILPLVAASCNKWLDVKPKSEIKSDVMFETEQGFKDAITGCYITMSDATLYGGNLTLTFLDAVGQQYEMRSSSASLYNAALFQYSNYTSTINSIWSNMYNVIANINNIIENLEVRRDILHPTNYGVFKAEMHALRAFLYLDLVRMYTWGNIAHRPEVFSQPAIPYVKVYDKVITPQHTLEEVLGFIREDVDLAIDLFEVWDPISTSDRRPENYEVPNSDKFYDNNVRMFRMNIRSAIATRMRLEMWQGDSEGALKDAERLITELPVAWINNDVINHPDVINRDLTFSTEQLFGVETYKRFDNVVKRYFKLTANDDLNINYDAMYISDTRCKQLFEIEGDDAPGASDYRWTRLFDRSSATYQIMKFWEYEKSVYTNRMPLIRKPEIYYTAAECLLDAGGDDNKAKAVEYLNQVRYARGIPQTLNLSTTLTEQEVRTEIEKEWRKEFIGEGQIFYFYKRLGYTKIPNTAVAGSDKVYIFPLPETEVDFGFRVDPTKKLTE